MSLRPSRVGADVAAFVQPILANALKGADITLAPVDLRDFKLPIYNENVVPASSWSPPVPFSYSPLF
jgi:hypothetical protein